ncbi:hypothetical protein [Jeotgalibacillus proteolyticus]|uniref:hypothetical protein n=1 Tax=Jeotgalibacillus proteolyticus TaxID=2082395 RepID=UPI003CF5DE1A
MLFPAGMMRKLTVMFIFLAVFSTAIYYAASSHVNRLTSAFLILSIVSFFALIILGISSIVRSIKPDHKNEYL